MTGLHCCMFLDCGFVEHDLRMKNEDSRNNASRPPTSDGSRPLIK